MADSPQDFYGATPSYRSRYTKLNTRKFTDANDNNKRVYSTGILQGEYEYAFGSTASPGSTHSTDEFLNDNKVNTNTFISKSSIGISTGPNGSIDSRYFVNIGDGNQINGDKTSLVVGNNQKVEVGSINISIIGGDNNETSPGITNSVLINGSGKVLNTSNTTVLDGLNILSTKPVQNVIHIVESELNAFNQYVQIQVIDGGKDTIRPFYGDSIVTIVNGSETPVYFYEK